MTYSVQSSGVREITVANILVVDDNEDVGELFKSILLDANHTVDLAHGPDEAITLAAKGHYDLVLLDLMLGETNGGVVALALRGLGINVPFVAITGDRMAISQELYDRARFSGRLLKPVRIKELVDEIDRRLLVQPAEAEVLKSEGGKPK